MTTSRDCSTDKALRDLIALMKEIESVESSLFDKHTAARLSHWMHTWFKCHGEDVIAILKGESHD